jgi:acetolactate synthase-1/2/3 large subunit
MTAVRDLLAHHLKAAGVRTIFGVPGGGGNLDLIDAAGNAGLPFVLTATETGGALAALAQTEVTGHPSACLTTLGPGAASVANGVACAFLDRAPIVVFTDSHSTASRGAFEHQQFDHQAFFRPITKWSGRLAPGCAQATIERAFEVLSDLPPGPVHIDCPEDFATTAATSLVHELPGRSVTAPRDGASLHELVSKARRPLVIVGLGARRPDEAKAVRAFVVRHNVPAMVTYKAKGVVPDEHACFAGVFTNARIEQAIVGSSDLIIAIGMDPVELLPRPWPYQQPTVYVGRWPVSDQQVPFALQRIGEIPAGLQEIDASLGTSSWDLDAIRSEVEAQRRSIDIPTAGGLSAQQVVRVAAERGGRDARVTVDAGAHMLPATMLWPTREPNDMLISNGLSTMGFALPAGIGAALADRDRRVIALTGDGGLLMCAAELLTAVRERLRIAVIVFSDESLSLIEIKQQRRQLQPAGVALGTVHWPVLAESFGVAAFAATNRHELAGAVDHAMTIDGPSLIEAKIDRSNYGRMLAAIRG